LDIPVPRVAHTYKVPGFEGESKPPLLHLSKLGREQLRIGDPPAQQGLIFKPANTNGDIARFILLFQGDQGFQRPNGQNSIRMLTPYDFFRVFSFSEWRKQNQNQFSRCAARARRNFLVRSGLGLVESLYRIQKPESECRLPLSCGLEWRAGVGFC
jgi:hypothetical protein